MTWNYRLVRMVDVSEESGYTLMLCEVYYDNDGKPDGYAEATIAGETLFITPPRR